MAASIPVWVPFLLVGLSFIGYRQSLPRVVKPNTLVAIALAMCGFSLLGVVSAFGAQPLALVLWKVGYGMAASLGARYFASRGLHAVAGLVHMPGSWAPLGLILGIFVAKFVLGTVASVQPLLLQQTAFVATMSLILGALSGGFGARAWAVHRCATASTSASA